ncbi:hypothetical protein COB55_03780 [Candidatus Wolfebacteria bacterium]|nr:MAG: hypothetical protein COB55_03780 [Candidatus Wolfebacteria bacterium]
MNLISKLRNHYKPTSSEGFWWVDMESNEISIYCKDFEKWKELKQKGYTDMELVNYFTQWLFWKFPDEMKEIKKIHYKESFHMIIYTRIL